MAAKSRVMIQTVNIGSEYTLEGMVWAPRNQAPNQIGRPRLASEVT